MATATANAPIVAVVNRRTDTIIRYAFLFGAAAVVVVMISIAANAALSPVARFGLLAGLGTLATASWLTLDVANPFAQRNPLMLLWGKPPRPTGPEVPPPPPIGNSSQPVRFSLALRPSLVALTASAAGTVVTGVIGYALARSPRTDGGLAVYVVFGGLSLLAIRSVVRIATAHRSLSVDADQLILGSALGYVPARSILRSDVALIEIAPAPPAKIAVVTHAGRRFEVRTDHLSPPGLAGYLSHIWPDLEWREMPIEKQKL